MNPDWTSEWRNLLTNFGEKLGYEVVQEFPTPLRGRIDLAWLISHTNATKTSRTGILAQRPEITFEFESLSSAITLRQRKINLFKCLEFDPMIRPCCHVQIIREKEYHFVPEGMGIKTEIVYDGETKDKSKTARELVLRLLSRIPPSSLSKSYKEKLQSVGFKTAGSVLHVGGNTANHTIIDFAIRQSSTDSCFYAVEGFPLDKITISGSIEYEPIFPDALEVFDWVVVSRVGKITREKRKVAENIFASILDGKSCLFFADKGIFKLFRDWLPVIPSEKGKSMCLDWKHAKFSPNLEELFGEYLCGIGRMNFFESTIRHNSQILAAIQDIPILVRRSLDNGANILYFGIEPYLDGNFRRIFHGDKGFSFLRGLLSELRGSQLW